MVGEILEQRLGEGRMLALLAIRRELAPERGVGDQHRTILAREPREAAKAAARIDAPRRTLRKGIVAAGIEQHDLLRRGARRGKQLIELDRAQRRLLLAFDLHVDRREHVAALDIHAVAGIIDERHLRSLRLALEGLEHVEQIGAGEIVMLGDLEAVRAEFGGDRLGVGHGVGEAREMLVFAHADDKRHALVGGPGARRGDEKDDEDEGLSNAAHHGAFTFPFRPAMPSASSPARPKSSTGGAAREARRGCRMQLFLA